MMKASMFAVASAAALILAGAAAADTASGPGGVIPVAGTGGDGAVWPSVFPTSPYVSTVNLGVGVASVNSVTLSGLSHTWVGDLQVVLFAPDGTGHNILVRPGFVGAGFGSDGDLTGGDYTFVESGGSAFPTAGAVAGGTYNQSFGIWASGTGNVFNTPMGSIAGGSGLWTLRIYDWAGGDVGELSGWTLDYDAVPTPGVLALIGMAGLAARRRRA